MHQVLMRVVAIYPAVFCITVLDSLITLRHFTNPLSVNLHLSRSCYKLRKVVSATWAETCETTLRVVFAMHLHFCDFPIVFRLCMWIRELCWDVFGHEITHCLIIIFLKHRCTFYPHEAVYVWTSTMLKTVQRASHLCLWRSAHQYRKALIWNNCLVITWCVSFHVVYSEQLLKELTRC